MTTDQGLLKIHVMNAGIGESIVLHLPTGEWGVIDCYASSANNPDTNATLQFLTNQGVKELAFLCLTHPHDDHYRGMSQLLEQFPVRFFWQFPSPSSQHLRELLDVLCGSAMRADDAKAVATADDLGKTLRIVKERRQAKQLKVKHMSDVKQLYPIPVGLDSGKAESRVTIHCLAPSSDHIDQYQERLRACFTRDGRLKVRLPALPHNMLSAILLIRYGDTAVVLGGDAEISNWSDTLNGVAKEWLAANVVKVSHHGSTNGYTSELWQTLSAGKETIAVVTPSRRHKLPKLEAVEHIRGYTSRVLTTCRNAVSFLTEEDTGEWRRYAPEVKLLFQSFFTPGELGICSLAFDDLGNCRAVSCIEPAGSL